MLIRELEAKTGLERATIRFYEKEGFITPVRKENGYREYSDHDCDTLLKVKLLRQLGVSLETIKGLQQGSEGFSDAMTQQILTLEQQLRSSARAKEICVQMRDDGVNYSTLDAAYYLELLERPSPTEPQWTPKPVPEFQYSLEYHPWRRFFARAIDLMILTVLLEFIAVVILRVRPYYDWIERLVTYGAVLLQIPVSGLLIHFFGTTPGKWLMCIRLESLSSGGKMSIRDAIRREFQVFLYGLGLSIPFVELITQVVSYVKYRKSGYTSWDKENDDEMVFSTYSYNAAKKSIGAGVLYAVLVLSLIPIGFDLTRPRYRGEDLTIEQFAANYNNFMYVMDNDNDVPAMKSDGSWNDTLSGNGVVIYVNGKPEDGYSDLTYRTEDGFIRTVAFEETWTSIFMFTPYNAMNDTVFSIAAAQDWYSLQTQSELAELLQAELREPVGSICFENLEIKWQVEAENCSVDANGVYFKEENAGYSSLTLYYEVNILK